MSGVSEVTSSVLEQPLLGASLPRLPAGSPHTRPLPPELITRVADSDVLAFDVDDTLNRGRGQPISDEAAELIFKFMLLDKQIAIISGRTFDEFRDIKALEPLLTRMRERNMQAEILVYSAGGGEKVAVRNDASFVHDSAYSNPYTDLESRQIMGVIRQLDKELNEKHNLRANGIEEYWVDYRHLAYQWSPYGKKDEKQYAFESSQATQQEFPPRMTRKELGAHAVSLLNEVGLEDFEYVVSGKTTVGFSRKGITKEKAMCDLLALGRVTYFGDEVSRRGAKTGNDNIVGEMAAAHAASLTVVSLDQPSGELPAGVVHVGGLLAGTMRVLREAHLVCENEAKSHDFRSQAVRELLSHYAIGAIKDITAQNAGHGMHAPYFIVDAENGRFMMRHIAKHLFSDAREAARYEVFVVNALRAAQIPFAEILPIADCEAEVPEDRFIGVSSDGTCHLLYRYVEGEVGSAENMDEARFTEMVRMLARMHRALGELQVPYQREYLQRSMLDLNEYIPDLEMLHAHILKKKQLDSNYCYSRGERLVLENANFIVRQLRLAVGNLRETWDMLPRLPIHSDYHPPNLIFEGDKIIGIIDLEHMREEPRLYDLAALTRLGTDRGIFHLENARRTVLTYNVDNKLTPEESEALPEIFRLKLLDRVSRLVNPTRHYESQGFDFTGVDPQAHSLALIDHNDKLFLWYQNIITSLRDLDVRVSNGDFRRAIQDKLDGERRTAEETRAQYLQNLRAKHPAYEIAIRALHEFDLSALIDEGMPVEKVAARDHGRWTEQGNFYLPSRKGEFAWCRLRVGDRVLFYTDKVVVYQGPKGDILINIRGNDLDAVKRGTEKALIVVEPDGDQRARAVRLLPISDRDLSRSSMAIQLTDSGFFDRFPALHDLLRYQLVWQGVDGGLRHRELLDALDIGLDHLSKAEARPDEVAGEDVSTFNDFRYVKSKVIRQRALDVIGKIYDVGRMSRGEFARSLARFTAEDISEDFRVIERSVKNDPAFVKALFANLFGLDIGERDLRALSLEYVDERRSKSIYKARFQLTDGQDLEAAISLTRHDPITPAGLTKQQIDEAIETWRDLSGKVPGIPTFGSHTWEIDYRAKELVSGGSGAGNCRKVFVNNIALCAYHYVPGRSLAEMLALNEVPKHVKREAINACREVAQTIFARSLELTGKGYFMERPEPYKFIVNHTADGMNISITDPQRLVHYPSAALVARLFDRAILTRLGGEGEVKQIH